MRKLIVFLFILIASQAQAQSRIDVRKDTLCFVGKGTSDDTVCVYLDGDIFRIVDGAFGVGRNGTAIDSIVTVDDSLTFYSGGSVIPVAGSAGAGGSGDITAVNVNAPVTGGGTTGGVTVGVDTSSGNPNLATQFYVGNQGFLTAESQNLFSKFKVPAGVEANADATSDSLILSDLPGIIITGISPDSIQIEPDTTTSIIQTKTENNALYQPLEATLTDIADGTIAEDLVNTANPWADNEVADDVTAGTASVATTLTIADNEATAETNAVLFTSGGDLDGGNLSIESDGDLTYNPSTGTFGATVLAASGNITVGGTVDGVDIAARDHDEVTLAGTPAYLTLSGQEITRLAIKSAWVDSSADNGLLTQTQAQAGYQPLDSDLTALAGISGVDGDIIYYNSGWTRLAKGSDGEVLKLASGFPSWASLAVDTINVPLLGFMDTTAVNPNGVRLFDVASQTRIKYHTLPDVVSSDSLAWSFTVPAGVDSLIGFRIEYGDTTGADSLVWSIEYKVVSNNTSVVDTTGLNTLSGVVKAAGTDTSVVFDTYVSASVSGASRVTGYFLRLGADASDGAAGDMRLFEVYAILVNRYGG